MSGKRYLDEYKIEAVKQVTERGHSVKDVAARHHDTQPLRVEAQVRPASKAGYNEPVRIFVC